MLRPPRTTQPPKSSSSRATSVVSRIKSSQTRNHVEDRDVAITSSRNDSELDIYGKFLDISDDEERGVLYRPYGDFKRPNNTDGYDKSLRSVIQKYVYQCPIRLWNTKHQRFFAREELASYIELRIRRTPSQASSASPSISEQVESLGRYAVLSHRWGDDEILFEDFADLSNASTTKQGYAKFASFSSIAHERFGCRFVWIDTACINKTSSSELDESVRSMYTWYKNSFVCIVYLEGVVGYGDFVRDEWFRRGWTLQELIASRRLKFFKRNWEEAFQTIYDISPPTDPQPQDEITQKAAGLAVLEIAIAAEIEQGDLFSYKPTPSRASDVFRWMARRETTRPEDTAYCLIGLLNVQLPIAYGEGLERAFYRLQLECAQHAEDRSLFAWSGLSSEWNSMLARHPEGFSSTRGKISSHCLFRNHLSASASSSSSSSIDPSFTFTNCGLRVMITLYDLPAIKPRVRFYQHTFRYSLFSENDTEVDMDDEDAAVVASSGSEFCCKLGILGVRNAWPFAVMLLEDREKSPARYRRLVSPYFRVLPSIENLVKKPPQCIFIE